MQAAWRALLQAEAVSSAAWQDRGFSTAFQEFMISAGFAPSEAPAPTDIDALCDPRELPEDAPPDLGRAAPEGPRGWRWRETTPPPQERTDWRVRIYEPTAPTPRAPTVHRAEKLPETLVWDLPEATLLHGGRHIVRGACGYIWGTDHVVSPYSSRYTLNIYQAAMGWRGHPIPREERPLIVLASGFYENYYHWFIDFLSKLLVFEKFILPEDVLIAVAADAPAYVFDSLAALGLGDSLRRMPAGPLSCRRLLIPARRCTDHYSNPEHIAWLRDAFGATTARPQGRRLYISRAGADKRRAVNDAEVAALLARWGFETVRTEQMSFLEQKNLFNQAEAIVGVHGAGLMNLLFMPTGGKILELRGDFADLQQWMIYRVAYMFLSNHCGHQHMFMPCPVVGEPDDDQDLRVDLDQLNRALEQMGL